MTQPDNSSPVIPEGWRLVPVSVLTAMVADAISASSRISRNHEKADSFAQELRGYLSGIGSPLRTETEVRAEARREALKEAEALANDAGGDSEYGGVYHACEAIRALIEKEPES